jgi:DHA2 family multidrug resistance protein-like MFS transporter
MSSSASSVDTEAAPRRAGLALTALILGAVVANLNLSVANVALPDIGKAFDAGQTQINLVAIGCTLGLAMSVLYLGALGDRYGRKLMLLLGMALTLPASAISAWAPSVEVLIAGRVFTGVAAGLAYPTTLALITALWGPGKARVRAIALWSGLSGGGAVLGPVIAGALLESFWWGSVFLIAVLPAAVVFVLVLGFVPAHVNESSAKVDNLGGVLSVVMIGTFVLGVSTIAAPGGFGASLALIGLAVVVGALFILRQRRASNPLYDLVYARRRIFWVAALSGMIVFGSFMGSLFIGQQFMQNVLGYSTLEAGVAVIPMAISMVIFSPVAGRMVLRLGSRATLLAGFAAVILGLIVMLVGWGEETAYAVIALAYVLVGAGAGLAMTPASRALTSSVPVTKVGMASGTTDLQRDLGGAIMQAVLGSLLTAGYAMSMAKAIGASPDADRVSDQTQNSLRLSYSSAEAVSQQFPEYASQIIASARESFLAGANWAYLAAIVASLIGAAIVWILFPDRQGEVDLLADYAKADSTQ